MTYQQAQVILSEHQKWRRGEGKYAFSEDPLQNVDMPYTPTEIGCAIDKALEALQLAEKIHIDCPSKVTVSEVFSE